MQYINASKIRELKWMNIKITAIYPHYRSWWLKNAEGKFLWRTFKYNEDWTIMEQKWDAVNKKFSLVPFMEKIDREWYKTYKKVFDIKIELEKPVTFKNWKWEDISDFEFAVQGLSAFKVKELLKATVVDDIPEENWKEKFDWEDDEYTKLKDVTFKFSVVWTWLDTVYSFKPTSKFASMTEISEIDMNDIPF